MPHNMGTTNMERKTLGQIAYEEDCNRRPTYPDGSKRKPWSQLDSWARLSWERNPTAREW